MSKYIDFSLASHGQPWSANAALWNQTGLGDQSSAAVIALIGDSYSNSTIYVLYGCVLTSSAGTTSVTSGMLFYGGVFYSMSASSYADPSGGNVNVINIVTTYGDGGGTAFEDGLVANVLYNKTVQCAAGTSGTLGLYSSLVFLANKTSYTASAINGATIYFPNNQYIEYGGVASSTNTITVSATNARKLTTVTLLTLITAGQAIAFSGLTVGLMTGALVAVNTGVMVIRLTYTGGSLIPVLAEIYNPA